MRKIMSCLILLGLLGLSSCGTSAERLHLVSENGHFTATPAEVIAYLNQQNSSGDFYTIPDFTASGDKIAIGGDEERTHVYLTFFTEQGGKATRIELELYTNYTEKSAASVMQYLSLLFHSITDDADQVSNLMTSVSDLTASGETNTSFSVVETDGIQISGWSNPGYYSFHINALEDKGTVNRPLVF